MVHVGEPGPLIDEVFDILTAGDIVTHCFNGKKAGSIRDTASLFEQARRLADEGVRMDIGHGVASFDFETARASIADGLLPHTISTDLHLRNINGPVYDLATTMSKLLAVGVPFDECIAAVTQRPRNILKLNSITELQTGEKADFTLFDLVDGALQTTDSQGNNLVLQKIFEPRLTIIGASAETAQRRGV
jgi:dihydroorotase